MMKKIRGWGYAEVPQAFADSLQLQPIQATHTAIKNALADYADVATPGLQNSCSLVISNNGNRLAVLTGIEIAFVLCGRSIADNRGHDSYEVLIDTPYIASFYYDSKLAPLIMRERPYGQPPMSVSPQEALHLEVEVNSSLADSVIAGVGRAIPALYDKSLYVSMFVALRYSDGRKNYRDYSTTEFYVVSFQELEGNNVNAVPSASRDYDGQWLKANGIYLDPYDHSDN
ncbi:MAG: hypothetical protein Q7W05_14220 [Deltaproteobacteria bacterium]|nr:hypothetical protein [Deltaproteobacteria bacterium]